MATNIKAGVGRLAVVCALMGGPVAVPEAEAAAHPLFMPGCTVVLLSGLPGDIQSENSFRDQMQNWLELAARSGQVRRLFVLCDEPGLVRLPSKPVSKAIKGDRKEFLDLGPALGAEKAPLVVIAWGHAGQQRSTPVLHVRGPRLTPADFAAVADQAHAPDSRWVLLFRGSGAFARKLASEHRAILCSDCDRAFTSDPIGMALLLKLLGDDQQRSFDQLAADFGHATAAWYQQRNLARTEEPSLWAEEAPPRLLARGQERAPAGVESAVSSEGWERTETQTQPPKDSKSPETQAPANTARFSDAWKDIRKVDPEKYPEADGVILRQCLHCTVGSSPAVVIEQEKFVQILTAEGKQYGDFDVSFAPPEEELEFLDCEVLSPDGKLARLDPDAVREAREQEVGDYRRPHRKFFSLPGVVPGAVVHVRFRSAWKEFPLPRVSLPLPVGDELPAMQSSLQVSIPKDTPFHFAFQNYAAPDPKVRSTSYSTSYLWTLENLPAFRNEVLSAPGQRPRLLISTFTDWKEFADWYGRISRLTDEVTPEIAAEAKELTANAKSDREKVRALYNYVTGLRYVAVPLGINSVRPHVAAQVLHNQYGDCKDKANLLNTLLHAVNIQADLVLVPRFSQAYDAVPGLAFNHAISCVRLEGETLWLDTTDDVCRFGMLPPGDAGRKVLPIDRHTTTLTQLPEAVPDQHRLTVTGHISWSEDASGMPAEIKAVAQGYPDYEFRATAREAKEHRASLPLLTARFRPCAGAFALSRQWSTPVSSLQDDFIWQAEGECVGLGSRSGRQATLRAPFWVPREWDLALNQRHTPLFLNQGYPLTLGQDFEFALPSGSKAMSLPKICENGRAPLRWRVEWTTMQNGKVQARFSARLQRGELTAGETALVQQQLRTLLAALGSEATTTLP